MALLHDIRSRLSWQPLRWVRMAPGLLGSALGRLWGRDVMLYVGGVSFFALLAIFPAVAILIGLYSLFSNPAQAATQAEAIAHMMPAGAEHLFQSEVMRLVAAPGMSVSAQSIFALVVGGYASHRGFKALLAGLSFIHDDAEPRGFVGFNVLALVVLVAAFALMSAISAVFLAFRVAAEAMDFKPLAGITWIYSEWTWSSISLTVAFTLVYRFAMASKRVDWRASLIGGATAAFMSLAASWACAVYVDEIAPLGATYGSLAAVIVFLIWLSWNVNAVFFGGAVATEVEIRQKTLADERG